MTDLVNLSPAKMVKIGKVENRKTVVAVSSYANEHSGVSIGVHTVKHRLIGANLLARRPTKKPTKN